MMNSIFGGEISLFIQAYQSRGSADSQTGSSHSNQDKSPDREKIEVFSQNLPAKSDAYVSIYELIAGIDSEEVSSGGQTEPQALEPPKGPPPPGMHARHEGGPPPATVSESEEKSPDPLDLNGDGFVDAHELALAMGRINHKLRNQLEESRQPTDEDGGEVDVSI